MGAQCNRGFNCRSFSFGLGIRVCSEIRVLAQFSSLGSIRKLNGEDASFCERQKTGRAAGDGRGRRLSNSIWFLSWRRRYVFWWTSTFQIKLGTLPVAGGKCPPPAFKAAYRIFLSPFHNWIRQDAKKRWIYQLGMDLNPGLAWAYSNCLTLSMFCTFNGNIMEILNLPPTPQTDTYDPIAKVRQPL